MRLRPLTEAECYARCYGARRGEALNLVRVIPLSESARAGRRERSHDALEPAAISRDEGRGLEAA